jgi:large subunit ribosomal protein L25
MEQQVIKAARREGRGSARSRRLRAGGNVPGVLYGHGKEVVPVSLSAADIQHLIESGVHLVSLDLDGKPESALIKDVQWDTWSRDVIHVDFGRVDLTEEVTVTVPLTSHGTPKEVNAGALLEQAIHDIEVTCTADKIPEEICVEVGEMEIGDAVYVRDLPFPEGVTTEMEADNMVFQLREPRELEEEEEAPPEELLAASEEPEVIGRGGKDEEEDQEEAAGAS